MRLIDADAEIKKIEEEIQHAEKKLNNGDQEKYQAKIYMT